MTGEYGPLGLHQKIITILCEELRTPGSALEVTSLRERLKSEGVGVPESVLRGELLQLAQRGDIKLVLGSTPPPSAVMTIHHIRPELCE